MGKTSKPLALTIPGSLYHEDKQRWDDLIEQGHDIFVQPDECWTRHWLGPNCWRMLDLDYLDVTIAAIRKEVYDQPTKQARTDTDSKPVAKRNTRKPKRQVAVGPARSPEGSGDGPQPNGGII